MEYKIITDGSCDLPPELCKEKGIVVVPFYVSFDSENYQKEIVEMPIRTFYEQMVSDPTTFPKSSMPSVQDYVDVFMPVVQENKAVICLCITTKFSGSYQSAMGARQIVLESFPQAQITVMDTTINTVLQGLFVLEAIKLYEANIPYEEVIKELDSIKKTGRIFFTVGNIDYLKHGGRIGKLAGLAGSMLGIKPLITLKEGEIFPSGLARSRKKSKDKVIDMICAHFEETHENAAHYCIHVGYGYDYEEAAAFRDQVYKAVAKDGIEIHQIGATVGVHTGPHPIGVGILKKYEYV